MQIGQRPSLFQDGLDGKLLRLRRDFMLLLLERSVRDAVDGERSLLLLLLTERSGEGLSASMIHLTLGELFRDWIGDAWLNGKDSA